MKPPLFHVGQAVVCLTSTGWNTPNNSIRLPIKDRVYTISDIAYDEAWDKKRSTWFLGLEGIPGVRFEASYFAPVEEVPDEALAELLEEVFTPVTA